MEWYHEAMIIAANWKAYVEDTEKAKKLFAIAKRVGAAKGVEIILAPPAPFLGLLASKTQSKVAFAGQDVSVTTGGAQTGESTAQILQAAGASYVIVGHSERRAAGETDEMVAEKIGHALAHNLIPILCVGEHERDGDGRYLAFVRAQITAALEKLSPKERTKVVLAYEPIWAIGKSAAEAIPSHDLAEMVLYLRKVLAELLPGKSSASSTVLYGGSVEPENARDLAGGSGVDGFLVGHASVDPAQFAALVKAVS